MVRSFVGELKVKKLDAKNDLKRTKAEGDGGRTDFFLVLGYGYGYLVFQISSVSVFGPSSVVSWKGPGDRTHSWYLRNGERQ